MDEKFTTHLHIWELGRPLSPGSPGGFCRATLENILECIPGFSKGLIPKPDCLSWVLARQNLGPLTCQLFFLMIFFFNVDLKVYIELVTIVLLFHVLVFWQ